MPVIRITVDGRTALTVEQAALRHKVTAKHMRTILDRAGVQPAAPLDSRKHLYFAADITAAISGRPGRGANLRRTE